MVNADLYIFLRGAKTFVCNEKDKKIACVEVNYGDMPKFAKCLGLNVFIIMCRMMKESMIFELNGIFESMNQEFEDYKNCFDMEGDVE